MTTSSQTPTQSPRDDYIWKRIQPLTAEDKSIDLSTMHRLQESWKEFRQRLNSENPDAIHRFQERIIRSMSIETGILERIYDVDRGTTEALITKGFLEDLIHHESTNVEPSALVDILQDQQAAIFLIQDLISKSRTLTKGVILDLHAIMTRHQDTVPGLDQNGNRVRIPLLHGAFKNLPNNPVRPDGSRHEYCPPEHVDSEIETLLELLSNYEQEDPFLVSVWLQHRFTQIHPFQDGNGRVARALTAYWLLKSEYLPLVIDRDMRGEYLDALMSADNENLEPLAKFLGSLEQNAILQALSIDTETEFEIQTAITSAVIASLQNKFDKRREAKRQEFLTVNNVAQELRAVAREATVNQFQTLADKVFVSQERPEIFAEEGGPDHGNSHWYKFEITKLNEPSKKWINFSEGNYFVKASIRYEHLRLVFVVTIHHIGKELTGVMEATSFALLQSYDEANDANTERIETGLVGTSVEPFPITWNTSADTLKASFSRWLDTCTAIAVKEWGDRL